MKKKIVFLLIAIPLFFAACNNDDGYSLDNYWMAIATVENPDSLSTFYFTLDDGARMWTATTDLTQYRPKDGQRIIAYYTILSDKADGSAYDHDVKLNNVYEVLTKDIFYFTPEVTQEERDSIGNDPIEINSIWIGSTYLNVEFTYPGLNKTHYINLVYDEEKIYDDDEKVHLEFRHNANNDYPTYNQRGIASFDFRSLNVEVPADSIELVIHTNEYNVGEKTYELVYKPSSAGTQVELLQKTFGNAENLK